MNTLRQIGWPACPDLENNVYSGTDGMDQAAYNCPVSLANLLVPDNGDVQCQNSTDEVTLNWYPCSSDTSLSSSLEAWTGLAHIQTPDVLTDTPLSGEGLDTGSHESDIVRDSARGVTGQPCRDFAECSQSAITAIGTCERRRRQNRKSQRAYRQRQQVAMQRAQETIRELQHDLAVAMEENVSYRTFLHNVCLNHLHRPIDCVSRAPCLQNEHINQKGARAKPGIASLDANLTKHCRAESAESKY